MDAGWGQPGLIQALRFGLLALAVVASVACGDDERPAEPAPATTEAIAAAETSSTTPPTTQPTTTLAPATTVQSTTTIATTTTHEPTSEELYAVHCAVCHGAELEGGVGPALGPGGHAHGHDDAELIELVASGRNEMPAFGEKLTEEEIAGLVAFLRAAQGG